MKKIMMIRFISALLATIISAIIITLTLKGRITAQGSLNLNCSVIFIIIIMIFFIFFLVMALGEITFVHELKRDRLEAAHKKEIFNYFGNGEKKVEYIFRGESSESDLFMEVVDIYMPEYTAQIVDKSLILNVINSETKRKIRSIKIKDLEFFYYHFDW